jgi:uncharacterized protein YidB (DUF937 family)
LAFAVSTIARSPKEETMALSPLTALLLGVLAYRTYQGKGRLADMFGRTAPDPPGAAPGRDPRTTQAPATGGGLGDLLRGNLGGLLAGGAAGGLLGSGLNDLLGRFQHNGYGDLANSWIGTGPNRAISPQQLQEALGPDTVSSLAEQAGVSDIDLLSGLSRDLPDAVDQLTPSGEIPRD